jgi:hypothetical protein
VRVRVFCIFFVCGGGRGITCVLKCVCVYVCVRDREYVCVKVRVCMCVSEREYVCVCG